MRTYTNISTRTGKPVKSKVELAERIDAKLRELRLHSGPDEFDPVLLMAIIAAESYDAGDTAMALTAAREVAQYVRPKLSAVAVVADVNLNVDPDVIGARDRFMALVMSGDKETLDPYRDDRTVDCDAFPEGLDSKDKFLAIVKANPHLVDELMEAEADEAIKKLAHDWDNAADTVASQTVSAVNRALYGEKNGADRDSTVLEAIKARFWADTEDAFYAQLRVAADKLELEVDIDMPLAADHPERALFEAAGRGCPAHHSLHPDIETIFNWTWK